MASVNKVTLLGNVGRDPELRYLPSGDPVANFSLATTETWKDKNGQKQERTEWHRVEVLGKLAEIVRDYVTKGKQVFVEGSITYQEYTDKDGVKKFSTKVKLSGPRAQLVLLGGGGRGKEQNEDTAAAFEPSDDETPF